MNVLFLTIGRFQSIESHSIYADLLRCFRDHGHEVFTITIHEKKTGKDTELIHEKGAHILYLKSGNVTGKNNLISKGLSQISLESTYIDAIKKYYSNIKFDLVLYSTPPITFSKAVEYIKRRDGAKSYLLLKDIFPQNAVDLKMMTKSGIKGVIYRYFRNKEKKLYEISDYIGCMSDANKLYVINNNPTVDPKKVEVCPNAVEVVDQSVSAEKRIQIRDKYGIPNDKLVFIYGGNLGKPQGIPFLIECLRKFQYIKDAYFLIIGSGNEYDKLQMFIDKEKPSNVKLFSLLPKEDYDSMVGACDVGMIYLDHRFTIPNFPSRILAYMQARIPVLAVTDINTDIGDVIVNGNFGWWCESNDSDLVSKQIETIIQNKSSLKEMGTKAWNHLDKNYNVKLAYDIIMNHFVN